MVTAFSHTLRDSSNISEWYTGIYLDLLEGIVIALKLLLVSSLPSVRAQTDNYIQCFNGLGRVTI
jgi:hypothetical protein